MPPIAKLIGFSAVTAVVTIAAPLVGWATGADRLNVPTPTEIPRVFSEPRDLPPLELPPQTKAQTQQADPRQAEASRLFQQGIESYRRSQFRAALQAWQQALALYQTLGDRAGAAQTLNNIGNVNGLLGNYPAALDYYQQSLVITREIGHSPEERLRQRTSEAQTLNNIGLVNQLLGNYPTALDYYQQSLVITREIGHSPEERLRQRTTEAGTLNNIGLVNQLLGHYPTALDYYQQSLVITREIGDRTTEALTLNNIGEVNRLLGNYPTALDYYQQSLVITREIGDRAAEAATLNNIGAVNRLLGHYPTALDYYQQSVVITREIGDRATEAATLSNIGLVNQDLGNYSTALDYYQQSLVITREIGDRATESVTLNNIGLVNQDLGNYPTALDYYQQSLVITRQIGDRATEAQILTNIGILLKTQDQPELAIIFLKAAVDGYEAIRTDNRTLDTALQQSYTDTVARTYRRLADLLLSQGRIPEAQQVLDLLKLEELREFTHTRAAWLGGSLQYNAIEQPVIDAHSSLIALGQKLYACRQTRCSDLDSLRAQQRTLTEAYESQVATFTATIADNRRDDPLFQDPGRLSDDAYKLLQANPQSVLIYPFVTEDKLWILWAAAGGAVGSVEVPVSQAQLSTAVQQFGNLFKSSGNLAALQASSQQLYDWLIAPLEQELQANDIHHLIFVNDRVTRYIPMAALYDGQHYLLERYTLSTVITPAITNTTETLGSVDASEVLGLGLTQAVAGFAPLPAVQQELDAIIRSDASDPTGVYPGQVLLDDAFTLNAIQANVEFRRVLHIATHAQFAPSRPEDSFIVLGNGQQMRIQDIETMQESLRDLHLVVLSACETALGGTVGDGTEIAGLSSYFLAANRAETVIASLWSVNDTSTSVLMQRFYGLLATGEFTKAEALRQAQLSLLKGEDLAAFETRLVSTRGLEIRMVGEQVSDLGFRHPYYWAAFILIGNGL